MKHLHLFAQYMGALKKSRRRQTEQQARTAFRAPCLASEMHVGARRRSTVHSRLWKTLLFSTFATLSVFSDQSKANGQTSSGRTPEIVFLNAQPSRQSLLEAKNALANGTIVEMKDERVVDFNAWLDVSIPPTRQNRPGNDSFADLPMSRTAPAVVAARIASDGALHSFTCTAEKRGLDQWATKRMNCDLAFENWATEEQTPSATAVPDPSLDSWTNIAQRSISRIDSEDNYFNDRIRLYRLNDIDPISDWYLVARDPVSAPDLKYCTVAIRCGWYTKRRDFQISLTDANATNPQFLLYDWSPQQNIGGGQGSFSIGFALSGVVPSPGVGYSFTWDQPDVDTTTHAVPTEKRVSWVENFKGGTPISNPPATSTGTFMSHHGVIYQVPEGTSSFSVLCHSLATFRDDTGGKYYNDPMSSDDVVIIDAPNFAVSQSNVALVKGGKAQIFLTAGFRNYSQRLKWMVVSAPSWLQVSPSQGAGATTLELVDNGQGTAGNIGYVELQTDPAYGAPSVESGPLRIKVEMLSQLPHTGVLLAGGVSWRDRRPLKTAEVWDPTTGRVFGTLNNMSAERAFHTATTLLNGEILLAGGMTGNYGSTNFADLYDPQTQEFSQTGSMLSSRFLHTATLLQNGKVLIAGGSQGGAAQKTAELYDPAIGLFSATGDMLTGRLRHTATLLSDGRVLIAGGSPERDDETGTLTAEIYDPQTGRFNATGDMNVAREGQTANLLRSGNIIVAGGTLSDDAAKSAEIYSPGDGTFTQTGLTGMMTSPRRDQASAPLLDGRVIVGGGINGLNSGEYYDPPVSWFYLTQGKMQEQRDQPRAVLLTNTGTALDGQVLFAGGVVPQTGSSQGTLLELFNPAGDGAFAPTGKMSTARSGLTATAFSVNLQQ